MPTSPLVLAFSGGLDTSYCVPRVSEQGYEVHTAYVNTGGADAADLAAVRRQAEAVGAASHTEVDARSDVFNRFVRSLIQGNVLRGEVYPLSVAAERTQQARLEVEAERLRTSLLSSLSHDLRTPLGVITGAARPASERRATPCHRSRVGTC